MKLVLELMREVETPAIFSAKNNVTQQPTTENIVGSDTNYFFDSSFKQQNPSYKMGRVIRYGNHSPSPIQC